MGYKGTRVPLFARGIIWISYFIYFLSLNGNIPILPG